jgi:hypothetical protein
MEAHKSFQKDGGGSRLEDDGNGTNEAEDGQTENSRTSNA